MTIWTLENDLVLLENQIPFFVLEKLFQLTVGRIQDRVDKNWSLTDYVWQCYGKKMRRVGNSTNAKTSCLPRDCVLRVYGNEQDDPKTEKEKDPSAGYYHILHNLHDRYVPRDHQTVQEDIAEMPSASELYFAGVKFVPGPDAGDSQFKFKFTEPKGLWWWCCRARFVIPPLQLNDDTELYLRNLIAFEQYCPGVSQGVTSYAFVMDMLVNSDKDVEGLEKVKVIRNCLGARKDATDLFNQLCKETALGDREFVFAETCIEATRYSKRFWPKNMLQLRRTYFASPWTFIAFIVGFMAFVISSVEFVRMLYYFESSNNNILSLASLIVYRLCKFAQPVQAQQLHLALLQHRIRVYGEISEQLCEFETFQGCYRWFIPPRWQNSFLDLTPAVTELNPDVQL
ncbi:UPF0481 protein At3g47200-like [Rhododendron vialii]|uniref:UPF0481 protein At3g47200-like n=1 Tax=Rhododendron vialii TaxID=182163 RepID=UPI00265D8D88|nr:UPF0481 protein At3g47200-like [Rhododendron vialii]